MEYVNIGTIVNTHGIKGELRIKSDFDRKDLVFKEGFPLYIGKNKRREVITSYRIHKNYDMVTFKGYNNINAVLNYLKSDVYVLKSDLNLNDDEYILDDLIGMSVIEDGEILGKVNDIVYNNSNILLIISGSREFYIPYKGDFIVRINLKNKEIITNNAKDLIL